MALLTPAFSSSSNRVATWLIRVATIASLLLCTGLANGQAWIQLQPGGTPANSTGNTIVYNSGTNTLIAFGGGLYTTNTTSVLSNANGIGGTPQWTTLNPIGTLPPGRRNHSAVYDQAHNRMIIFGGLTGGGESGLPAVNDVWVLANANGSGGTPQWTQLNPTGGPPSVRYTQSAVYDPNSNRLIIFGGECCGAHITDQPLSDTWVLTNANGMGGTPQWIPLVTAVTSTRLLHTAVYDPASNRMMAFGGATANPADVIVLTNANGTEAQQPQWTTLTTSNMTLSRSNHAAVYDQANNRMTVFGGDTPLSSSSRGSNDTWVLTDANGLGGTATWTQLSPAGQLPPARLTQTAGYDQANDRMMIFGGYVAGAYPTDVWMLTNANGIASSALGVTEAFPAKGGNAGQVTVNIIGSAFQDGVSIKLEGQTGDIVGTNTTVFNSSYLTTTFDLTGAPVGSRTLVATNPDGTLASLSSPFLIERGGSPTFYVEVIGRDKIRIGSHQQFYVAYGNSGNVDAHDVLLTLTFPSMLQYALPCSQPSPQQLGLPWDDAVDWCSLPQGIAVDNTNVVQSWILNIPANSSTFVPFTLTLPTAVGREFQIISAQIAPALPSAFSSSGDIDQIRTSAIFGGLVQAISQAQAIVPPADSSLEAKVKLSLRQSVPQDVPSDTASDDANDLENNVKTVINFCDQPILGLACRPFRVIGGVVGGTVGAAWGGALNSLSTVSLRILKAGINNYVDPEKARFAAADAVDTDSDDPNDISGPLGVGNLRYVGPSSAIPYSIFFENKSTATAPALKVAVTDMLNPALIDLTTLVLGPITVGANIFTPPAIPLSSVPLEATVDLRPVQNLLVNLNASLDLANSALHWSFSSIDPSTGQPPTDPETGFLPPGSGGNVSFLVQPRNTLSTGTQLLNKASIVFDSNASIDTPAWTNTIDTNAPISGISSLPAVQTCSAFNVKWSGSDVGSGLSSFTIFFSDNGGPIVAWLSNTTSSSAVFSGQLRHTYGFYSIATDLVGNVESAKNSPDTSTYVSASADCSGEPLISASVLSKTATAGGLTVLVRIANGGVGNIHNIHVNQLLFRTLSGSGIVSATGPSLPVNLGNLTVGQANTITLTLSVPATVARFSITENGTDEDVLGNSYAFSVGQTVSPH